MIILSEEEINRKNEQEAAFWFRQASAEHNTVEHLARRVEELKADIEDFKKIVEKMHNQIEDDKERFQAITDFWHTARETGYNTSWSIGGITAKALREETEHAKNYRAPSTILESDLVIVGKMDKNGALYPKAMRLVSSDPVEVVYVYRPKQKPTKAKAKHEK